jgi:hypothetical protein
MSLARARLRAPQPRVAAPAIAGAEADAMGARA